MKKNTKVLNMFDPNAEDPHSKEAQKICSMNKLLLFGSAVALAASVASAATFDVAAYGILLLIIVFIYSLY